MKLTVDKVSNIIKNKYGNVEQVYKPYGKPFYIAIINGKSSIFKRDELIKLSIEKETEKICV